MEVTDNTLNKNFRELNTGMCFVWNSGYFMKIRIYNYDEYGNNDGYTYVGLNLESGLIHDIREEEKVRLIKATLLVN